jgi:hypothetical protein
MFVENGIGSVLLDGAVGSFGLCFDFDEAVSTGTGGLDTDVLGTEGAIRVDKGELEFISMIVASGFSRHCRLVLKYNRHHLRRRPRKTENNL